MAQSTTGKILQSFDSTRSTEDIRKKTLIIHVLHIVLNGQSFLSSDSVSRTRGRYKIMFPDSMYANLTCGRTKATYVSCIGPFARAQLRSDFHGKFIGIHVDDTSYNRKSFSLCYVTRGSRLEGFVRIRIAAAMEITSYVV